jgi:hypothetical protein
VINRLRKLAIYGQPQLSLEHQGRAKRYVVRGVESGGATDDVGYYVSFAGENGEPLPWLQTLDSLTVNGPHAVVIAPVLTRIEVLRIARTYELCITRHRPVAVEARQRPKLEAEEVFRGYSTASSDQEGPPLPRSLAKKRWDIVPGNAPSP